MSGKRSDDEIEELNPVSHELEPFDDVGDDDDDELRFLLRMRARIVQDIADSKARQTDLASRIADMEASDQEEESTASE